MIIDWWCVITKDSIGRPSDDIVNCDDSNVLI